MRFCSVCDTDPKFYDTIRDNIRDCVGFVLTESRPNDYPSNAIPGHKRVRDFLRPLT